MVVNFGSIGKLHNFPKIHYGDTVAYMSDNKQVMRYKKVSKTEFVLQFVEHIYNQCLN